MRSGLFLPEKIAARVFTAFTAQNKPRARLDLKARERPQRAGGAARGVDAEAAGLHGCGRAAAEDVVDALAELVAPGPRQHSLKEAAHAGIAAADIL